MTAPAGYGKSTLLVEWARSERRPVAWVSLDHVDDDPSALLFLLAAAFERAMPEHAGLAAAMSGLGVSALGRGAPRVASMFSHAPVPFALLLDDLHELRAPACQDVLTVVLSGIPPGSQVVTASRDEQPHLARLRASGDAVELRAGTWPSTSGRPNRSSRRPGSRSRRSRRSRSPGAPRAGRWACTWRP